MEPGLVFVPGISETTNRYDRLGNAQYFLDAAKRLAIARELAKRYEVVVRNGIAFLLTQDKTPMSTEKGEIYGLDAFLFQWAGVLWKNSLSFMALSHGNTYGEGERNRNWLPVERDYVLVALQDPGNPRNQGILERWQRETGHVVSARLALYVAATAMESGVDVAKLMDPEQREHRIVTEMDDPDAFSTHTLIHAVATNPGDSLKINGF